MPKGTLYIDAALTNVAVNYKNTDFIGDTILPSVNVAKQSGKVYKFGKDAFRIQTDVRAPGTKSNRVQSYSVSSDTYDCDNHALYDTVPNEDAENADAAIQPEITTAEGLTDMILLAREKALSAALFNTTTFASYYTALANSGTNSGTYRWDDYTGSDPVIAADTAIENVRKSSGARANIAIMGSSVFMKLKRHPQLLDMFKYTAGGVLNEQQVAEALGVARIAVGRAIYNSAQEDTSNTFTSADVWGKFCLFAYISPVVALRKPSLGYSYTWNTGVGGYQVYKTVDDGAGSTHSTIIEVMKYFDDVVHGADFGYLYSTVIS
jgi:hypothetical protein